MRGVLITVEGVEGSGKTTQCERLGQWLHARGFEVVLTSEPDGTRLGSAIRGVFEREAAPPPAVTQTFLFIAARPQHLTENIPPALQPRARRVCDRYTAAP